MASLSFATPLTLLREKSNYWPICSVTNAVKFQDLRSQKWCIRAVSRKRGTQHDTEDPSVEESTVTDKDSKNSRQPSRRSRKKATVETPQSSIMAAVSNIEEEESSLQVASAEDSKKIPRKSRRKASLPSSDGENIEKKVSRRRTKKRIDSVDDENINKELNNLEVPKFPSTLEGEKEDLLLIEDQGDDISFTYGWPPLVCCFGSAQLAFIPSGRPANRLIDHDIHETKKGMFWSPDKFVRAPGSSSSSVAVALASLGGRVAFMGKLGDDELGQNMLYHLNVNKVQTRSIKINSSKPTAVSHMKMIRRGGLRMTCIRPCAEDSLLSSELNIDVLKEAKMFYFNSSSLLDPNMRTTTMQAIKVSKKLGGVIFFDLNLPLPLWQSSEEAKIFTWEAWKCADVIEVTKQELEFLCGIEPMQKFDTKDNDKSKFIHYKKEVIQPLWTENLKVLFMTNGTSKIHYYTEKDNGWVHGMEDAPISPFTGDSSASGDAIVAALMRMLTVQPHLATDKGYLEHMIKYAIDCGVINLWMLSRIWGFPPKEGMGGLSGGPDRVRSISEKEFRTVGAAS